MTEGVFRALTAGLKPGQHDRLLRAMTLEETRESDWDWASWAHCGQLPPDVCPDGSPWRTWVLIAGRGFGKTLAGAKWITAEIAKGEALEIALVGATLDEARRVMVEGRSGLLTVADAWVRDWHPSLRQLRFTTGAVATLFSGASPEQLRGPEHHLAWCDELAKWEKPRETWDMLQFGLRLGGWPRALITTTPRPGPVLRAILAEPDTVRTGGPTGANPHTSEAWRESTKRLYAGTRLGRQELHGELLPDAAGALWTVELLERCRVASPSPSGEGFGVGTVPSAAASRQAPPPSPPLKGRGEQAGPFTRPLTKIVIAVDPPAGDGTCGIIACAKDVDGIAHVLADHSVTAMSPEGWARAVADAVRIWTVQSSFVPSEGSPEHRRRVEGRSPASVQAPFDYGLRPPLRTNEIGSVRPGREIIPLVVAEKNQGGAMVKSVLHTADPGLRVKLVTATVGKAERAAPVAMLFEAGRVVLRGAFPELEAELLGMIAGGDYEGPGTSPDRADAMVWGLTELMLGPERVEPSVRSLWSR